MSVARHERPCSLTSHLLPELRLLLVTDDEVLAGRDLVDACLAAVRGGVTAVQLRLKHAAPRELAAYARALLLVLPVPLYLNDRLDVALAVGARGVHLGPDDVPPALARRIAPRGLVIGASVGSAGEVERGMAADYWGIGPWRATGTKADAGAALGAEGFRRLQSCSGGRPCVAIGGIRPADVQPALATGAAGVAVVSGILGADDIEAAAQSYATAT